MKRKTEQPADAWQQVPMTTTDPSTPEEPLLMIFELEPRLTPDGWGSGAGSNNHPPGGQVGWGC
jgi:hypothetical protein